MENRPDRVRSLHSLSFPFLSFLLRRRRRRRRKTHSAFTQSRRSPNKGTKSTSLFSAPLFGRRLLGRFVARVKFSRALLSLLGKKKSTRRRREVVVVVKERSLSLGSSQTQRYNKTHTTTVIMVVTKMPDGSSFSRPLEFRVFLKNLKP